MALKYVKERLVPWKYPLRRLNLFSIEITLLFALKKPKIHTKRYLASLSRLRYFYGGHVSYDAIIWTIVKPQMGWEWLLQAKDKISVILCLYSKNYPCPEWANL